MAAILSSRLNRSITYIIFKVLSSLFYFYAEILLKALLFNYYCTMDKKVQSQTQTFGGDNNTRERRCL